MKKKRIISLVVLLLLLTTLLSTMTACFSSESIPIPTVEEDVYIYDDDSVIDDDVEQELNQMIVELEEKTKIEFVVVSTESLLEKSIEDYSNELFNTLGIGKKGEDNGLLLLFSRTDERVRLEVGRGLESILNDSKCGRILDDYFVPYRDNDEYTKATEMTVEAILNIFVEEYDIDIQGLESNSDSDSGEITEDDISSMLLLFIFIIIVVVVLCSIFGDNNSSSNNRYSDGFSSDSSEGGFGGGFSGGGGASR